MQARGRGFASMRLYTGKNRGMLKVLLLSLLMLLGLAVALFLPNLSAPWHIWLDPLLHITTMTALAFIMIRVGYDFDVDKQRPGVYAFDYFVAATAAALPWIFCTMYFVFVMKPPGSTSERWTSMMLLSRFAAPTSAGVLFSMLTAAGLSTKWVFRKARVLAIFDDVDTILLVILLQMVMVGRIVWQLGLLAGAVIVLLAATWRYLHAFRIPGSWPWVLGYACALAASCEAVTALARLFYPSIPLYVEVLLPAFALGAMMAHPAGGSAEIVDAAEKRVSGVVTACFMFLAGASMSLTGAGRQAPVTNDSTEKIILHVLALTLLSNLGKMFPAFCYRRDSDADGHSTASRRSLRERLALGVCMFPRGEVGAGVLVIASFYKVDPAAFRAACLSLAFNLVCAGPFILLVKWLAVATPDQRKAQPVGRGI
jgi:hypothetical protein